MNKSNNDSFRALHAVYHERDFRVRVNDVMISFVRRILATESGVKTDDGQNCPACKAGFDYLALQPNAEDR